jgi:hypothetical protein
MIKKVFSAMLIAGTVFLATTLALPTSAYARGRWGHGRWHHGCAAPRVFYPTPPVRYYSPPVKYYAPPTRYYGYSPGVDVRVVMPLPVPFFSFYIR